MSLIVAGSAPDHLPCITILLIGQTQQGKSTFVNRLLSLATTSSHPREGAREGEGGSSCTTRCTIYECVLPLSEWKLVDTHTGRDIDVSLEEHKLLSRRAWRKYKPGDASIVPRSNERLIRLRVIDTPGLDDSEGRDFENLCGILNLLNHESESKDFATHKLTAVALVYKASGAFSNSFQQQLKTYQRCMPNLFNVLSVINTDFNLPDWAAERQRLEHELNLDETCLEYIERQRRKAFKDLLGLDPTHFFIDNKPNGKHLLEELRSRIVLTQILEFWHNAIPMKIEQMRLAKSPSMIAVDNRLEQWLQYALSEWSKEKGELQKTATKEESLHAVFCEREQTLDNALKRLDDSLKLRDTEDKYPLNTYTTTDHRSEASLAARWMFRQRILNELHITEPNVEEFKVDAADTATARWVSKNPKPAEKAWVGRYEAAPGELPRLTAVSYTTNRVYYRDTIESLKQQRRENRDDRAKVEIERVRAGLNEGGDGPNTKSRLDTIVQWITEGNDLCQDLRDERPPISWTNNEAARRRYRKGMKQLSSVSVLDLLAAAKIIKPGFEEALRDVFSGFIRLEASDHT